MFQPIKAPTDKQCLGFVKWPMRNCKAERADRQEAADDENLRQLGGWWSSLYITMPRFWIPLPCKHHLETLKKEIRKAPQIASTGAPTVFKGWLCEQQSPLSVCLTYLSKISPLFSPTSRKTLKSSQKSICNNNLMHNHHWTSTLTSLSFLHGHQRVIKGDVGLAASK